MKVPMEWLKEYVTIRLSPRALAERLTMAGLEVVAVEDVAGRPVLDLEITPNRADCLSIIGVAREVAAISGARLKPPPAQRSKSKVQRPLRTNLRVRIEDRGGCRRYIGRVIHGVRIGASPDWMQRRLTACGIRPINNVVDITNYVLLERGQPLHAFDCERVAGPTIRVRRAQPNESLTTLDGVKRALSTETLVIADAAQPVAVAGVMGGTGTEVTPGTTTVLLESAQFDPVAVRRAARRLGLATESSYRFERGVDPAGVEAASRRAAALICELAGGTLGDAADVGAPPAAPTIIAVDCERMSRWLGLRIPPSSVRTALARLSCRVASSGTGTTLRVSVPSFRQDLTQAVDLYEEVARLEGYDRIPSTLPEASMLKEHPEGSEQFRRVESLRDACAGLGLTEAITWSLVSEADLARCGMAATQAVRLVNPLSQDHALLRPSLLVGLLHVLRRNAGQGVSSARVFELGHVVRPATADAQHPETTALGIALVGDWLRDWKVREPCDFFRLKGLIQALAARCRRLEAEFVGAALPWAEPGQGAVVRINGQELGIAGALARAVRAAWDLEEDVWFAELSVERLSALRREAAPVSAPTTVPPAKRDLSVLLDDGTPFETVERVIAEAGGPLAVRVELIDRYTGPSIPAGKHSLTFSIEYREPSRTLTSAEVDALHQRIRQALTSRFNATLR